MAIVCVYPKERRGTLFDPSHLHAVPIDVVDKFVTIEGKSEFIVYENKRYKLKSRWIQGIIEKYIITDKKIGLAYGRKSRKKKWCS